MIYKITKIGKSENPFHKNSDFGESFPFHLGIFTEEPKVGQRFRLNPFSPNPGERGIDTTQVVKIIDESTFETLNSIYKYEKYLRTFTFYQKNSSAVLTLSAPSFEQAEEDLKEIVKDTYGWRVEDEEGEDF
jgi:hypothetical protein